MRYFFFEGTEKEKKKTRVHYVEFSQNNQDQSVYQVFVSD